MLAGSGVPPTTAAGQNYFPFGELNQSTTQADVETLLPLGGTLSDLYVYVSSGPGTGNTWGFNVMVNGTYHVLHCSINGSGTGIGQTSATSCAFTSGTYAVSAGDTLDLRVSAVHTNAAFDATWSVELTP